MRCSEIKVTAKVKNKTYKVKNKITKVTLGSWRKGFSRGLVSLGTTFECYWTISTTNDHYEALSPALSTIRISTEHSPALSKPLLDSIDHYWPPLGSINKIEHHQNCSEPSLSTMETILEHHESQYWALLPTIGHYENHSWPLLRMIKTSTEHY